MDDAADPLREGKCGPDWQFGAFWRQQPDVNLTAIKARKIQIAVHWKKRTAPNIKNMHALQLNFKYESKQFKCLL